MRRIHAAAASVTLSILVASCGQEVATRSEERRPTPSSPAISLSQARKECSNLENFVEKEIPQAALRSVDVKEGSAFCLWNTGQAGVTATITLGSDEVEAEKCYEKSKELLVGKEINKGRNKYYISLRNIAALDGFHCIYWTISGAAEDAELERIVVAELS
ncbi:MAG: hypothetical protein ACRC35_05795 [Angustibacter sp.]